MAIGPLLTATDVCSPVVIPLDAAPQLERALTRFARHPYCLFLDSAITDPTLGRYSFLAADPFEVIRLDSVRPAQESGLHGDRDAPAGVAGFVGLANRLAAFAVPTIEGLPPFQGGAAGLFAYDLGRGLERLPAPRIDEFGVPPLAVGLYDVVVAADHAAHRGWIISWGFPETDPSRRQRRAERRAKEVCGWLAEPGDRAVLSQQVKNNRFMLPETALARQFPMGRSGSLKSNFDRDGYLRIVERAIEYIYAGDIFQVNLAQRLLHPEADHAISLYLRLRDRNPAPFAGFFDVGDFQVVSASPERFLRVRAGEVEARPIKGTCPRTARPEADFYAGDELRQSEKDRAENVMIVDLIRNDLSKVCRADSVRVTQLCELEHYAFVQHLVSAVRGQLDEGFGPLHLLRGSFPGGSVTGAPKVRAMQIIAELEATARGAYCGSLGYVGFDGSMDTNILIRTITAGRGWWQAPVGGGIVAQSDPEREYEETWHKAEGLLRAMH